MQMKNSSLRNSRFPSIGFSSIEILVNMKALLVEQVPEIDAIADQRSSYRERKFPF
jgi:hypothetical protein